MILVNARPDCIDAARAVFTVFPVAVVLDGQKRV